MLSNAIPDRIEGDQRIFDNEGRVSSLLFQSVMFAGVMFIDVHYLYSAGYGSRRNALECFFRKGSSRDSFIFMPIVNMDSTLGPL
jgi:hypothetical protein